MDAVDLLILRALSSDGRVSWAKLGADLGLSRQAVADRVQKLEQSRVINGYVAVIAPEAVGADLTAFIGVTVERSEHCAGFLEAVRAMPEIQECHHMAGEDSYLLKVRTAGTRFLEQLITHGIKKIPGVVRTRTSVVLSTAKESVVPPLPGGTR